MFTVAARWMPDGALAWLYVETGLTDDLRAFLEAEMPGYELFEIKPERSLEKIKRQVQERMAK